MDEIEKKKRDWRTKAGFYVIFLFGCLSIIWQMSLENGSDNIILFLKDFPIATAIIVVPILFFIFSVIKANTKEQIKDFLTNHLFRYITKFVAFIITAYLAYFVLIPYKIKDFTDFILVSLIIVAAFIVFLMACWLEDIQIRKPLTKEIWKKVGIYTVKPLLLIALPTIILLLIYWLAVHMNIRTAMFISFMNAFFIITPFSSIFKKRWTVITYILIMSVFQPILLYSASKVNPGIMSISDIIIGSVIGSVLIIISLIVYISTSEDMWLKKYIKTMGQ